MSILANYTKQVSTPLKSITIKLDVNQVKALREFKVNLGAWVRDMLNDSDLMQYCKTRDCYWTMRENIVKNISRTNYYDHRKKSDYVA